ncbi:DUF5694 domain-containing protein [Maribacter sp. Asnod2-G09]|uniref:DUF5694 domain-containing protein n=1 Tax=Maribacter sp. Asnod2-G09 TaxID=3160577 RepID=UPI0038691139
MNKHIRLRFLIIISISSLISCQIKTTENSIKPSYSDISKKTEVLLVGTFHFSNFDQSHNIDIIQTNEVDVLTEKNQKELELICNKIAKFNPSKIFVEYPFSRQSELDSIYENFVPEKFELKERDEGEQLSFRVAKLLGHKRIFACDYRGSSFPYNTMIQSMKTSNQNELIASDQLIDEQWENNYNDIVNKNQSLLDVLYFLNNEKERKIDRAWFLNFANKAGTANDTIGTFLASEWSRRNLHMYSKIQKQVTEKDDKIMILLGSSHIAILKDFINYNPNWATVELKDLMENN